ncbi:hypothetical protein AK812_SmicGene44291 [Symbiodinium microadriaticum]|uniref:Uncharacterized protein n=1 Tax=Symbiodinium microadriaticum TaxID=2951 RepID=A0A1Q9BZ24_SYMMI|nr:hypothetical protein AK812_SmicGene44291 [Symbiodinium microadriaticum]
MAESRAHRVLAWLQCCEDLLLIPKAVRARAPMSAAIAGLAQKAGNLVPTSEPQTLHPWGGCARRDARWLSSDVGFMSLLLESITDILPILCVGLIWRLGDIRLWCQTTFAGALLMTLKGFVSWATVVPDAQGWKACKDRLGIDGLRYFREDRLVADMLADILLLEVRGFWFARSRRRLCADTMFSGGTSLSVLFCTSLCEASIMLSSGTSQRGAEEADALLPAIAQCMRYLLVALTVGNLVVPVLEGAQRAEAVALGVVVAVAVCNSPVLALAVDAWCRSWPVEDAAAPGLADTTPLSPTSTAALMGCARFTGEEDMEHNLVDLGKVLIPPPWSVGREYCYLRQHPLPEASAQKGVMQQLLAILRQSQEQLAKKEQKKLEMLKKEQADELVSAQRSDRFAEQRIQEALSDQQRMLNSRARRKRTQTLDFRQSGPSADGLLLASAMNAMKPSRSEGFL